MRKLIITVLLVAAMTVPALADHPQLLGVGVIANAGFSGIGAGANLGASLKLTTLPLYWGVFVGINNAGVGLQVTGDYYFIDTDFITERGFDLDWYLGVGGYLGLGLWDSLNLALGVRGPVGLSWHINEAIETWLGAAVSLGLNLGSGIFADWSVPVEIGLRYWLK